MNVKGIFLDKKDDKYIIEFYFKESDTVKLKFDKDMFEILINMLNLGYKNK